MPERIQQVVPQSAGVKRERKLDAIDLDATAAVASGQGPIYVSPHVDEKTVVSDLVDDLSAATDADGNQLFDGFHRAEDIYHGPYAELGPAVIVDQRPGVHVNDGLGGGEGLTEPDRWAAENTRSGMFVAAGPDFADAGELDRISITDIAPTLLATFGVDVPTDVCGRVLDVFDDGRSVGTQDPIGLSSRRMAGSDNVANRLQQLGYMEGDSENLRDLFVGDSPSKGIPLSVTSR